MRRLLVPIAAVVVVVVAVGLILGLSAPSNAATIGNERLTNSSFQTELKTVANSSPYLCYLNAQALEKSNGRSGLGPVFAANSNGWATTYAATLLGQRVVDEVIGQWAKANPSEVVVTKAQATADLVSSMNSVIATVAGSSYECSYSGAQTLETMPLDFVQREVAAQQASESFLITHGGVKLDAASLENYYNQHISDFDTYCLSGILVGNQALAESLRTQALNGASFAALAKANSLDSASAAKGGALGCFSPASASYAAVLQDTKGLSVGGITQPLASGSSDYVILQLTSRSTSSFGSVAAEVRQAVLSADGAAARPAAVKLFSQTAVSVNPLYGSWQVSAAANGVVIPVLPPATWIPNASVNTPLG